MTQNETTQLRYGGIDSSPTITVNKSDIDAYSDYLCTQSAYRPANVDTHISLMYSGNKIAINEFLDWMKFSERDFQFNN